MAVASDQTVTDPQPPHHARRMLWRLVRVGLLTYLGILLVFTAFETSLVYFPSRYPDGDWELPSGVEDAWFESPDGTKLHGWFVNVDHPKAVILFSHGNGGSIANRRDLLELFRRLDVSALLWDYRGYGRSEGESSETGILQDARAARAWLAKKSGVKETDIVLWGESLGGGVSVDLAQDGARGLILENTFTSLPDVAAHHYPWLPTRTLMQNRYNSISKITKYHGPLLQFHGDADTIVPFEIGRQLFEAANEPKQFVSFNGADHNDPRSPELSANVAAFLARLKQ
jgi:uncharacterized protein